jgi:PAS domain S-box-containing protein
MRTPEIQSVRVVRGFAQSLRFKATVAVATFIVMISVLLSALFVIHVERIERQNFLATMNGLSARLAELVAHGVEAGDREGVRSVVRPYLREPRILYVSVHDRNGPIESFTGNVPPALQDELRENPPPAPEDLEGPRARWLQGRSVYDLIVPVVTRARDEGGFLRLGFSFQPARERALELRWRTAAIAAAMIVLGIFGTMFLVGTIVGPIQELAGATERISEGDFNIQMTPTSEDDVGVLTRSFNEMTGKLRDAKERSESWNRELELRVREKTREIEETRQHLMNIVENVGASILVADLDGTIVSANGHTMQIFGTKPEWAIGLHLDEFTGKPDRNLDSLRAALIAGEGPIVYETSENHLAHEMDLLITHTLLRHGDGKPAGIVQITKDITTLRGMEERLVDSERLSRMGEMAGEIGHELNNYLMAIGGRAELIPLALDRGNQRKVRASAEIIVDQIAEMRKLTDGLLESARKESSPRDIDLNDLVRGTVEFVKPQNKYDRIEFVVRLAEGSLPIHADPQQIRQVLLNLLANGAESVAEMRPYGGRMEVETFREGNNAGLRVTDNGVGIDDDTKARLFEPHFTTKARGHGFGLAVCHRVVTNHRGHIGVSSTRGKGATFAVRLPLLSVSDQMAVPVAGQPGRDQLRSS